MLEQKEELERLQRRKDDADRQVVKIATEIEAMRSAAGDVANRKHAMLSEIGALNEERASAPLTHPFSCCFPGNAFSSSGPSATHQQRRVSEATNSMQMEASVP